MIFGIAANARLPDATSSMKQVSTSLYRGSPVAPGSFVRSRTAIAFTVAGRTSKKCFAENGR
jgi:hypothetical protein